MSDPRGWEALTQQEAEQDARRRELPRHHTGGCFRCGVTVAEADSGRVLISPTGKAHREGVYGCTDCGIDATGDDWWWPL